MNAAITNKEKVTTYRGHEIIRVSTSKYNYYRIDNERNCLYSSVEHAKVVIDERYNKRRAY